MLKKIVLFATLLSSLPAFTADSQRLLYIQYGNLKANRPYTTGLRRLKSGAVKVDQIRVNTYGSYCQFISYGLEFQREPGGPLYRAKMTNGSTFEIGGETVYAIEYKFEQEYWTGIDCDVEFLGGPSTSTSSSSLKEVNHAANLVVRASALLSTEMTLNDKYASVVPAINAYFDVVRKIELAAEKGLKTSCLLLGQKLPPLWEELSSSFYKAHAEALDPEIERGWDELKSRRDSLTKALDGLSL